MGSKGDSVSQWDQSWNLVNEDVNKSLEELEGEVSAISS